MIEQLNKSTDLLGRRSRGVRLLARLRRKQLNLALRGRHAESARYARRSRRVEGVLYGWESTASFAALAAP